MLYEKKLMILTGQGKGVVLIEKSGLGVKFALRTFSLPVRTEYKAGIITPKTVIIRDLPATSDPAAVFFVDGVELESLHFAVFDTALRLYGSTGVKMWEANVMDILLRHCAPSGIAANVPPAPTLPPIGEKPRVLPLPDGTGIPQSRLALYGDDALAESDFYTPFDLASHFPQVDAFLDAPRVLTAQALDGGGENGFDSPILPTAEEAAETDAPAMQEHEPQTSEERAENENETDGASVVAQSFETEAEILTMPNPSVPYGQSAANAEVRDETMSADISEESNMDDNRASNEIIDATDVDTDAQIAEERAIESSAERTVDIREAAACRDTRTEMPWEMTARWLNSRASREAVLRRPEVPQVADVCSVPKLREVSFFERLGTEITKLFSSAPRDGELAALLPDIEWVKVSVDSRNSVSVGRSGDAFLCYAVAGSYEKIPPIDNAQWLPKLRTAPTGKGYWLVFQDLGNGNVIV